MKYLTLDAETNDPNMRTYGSGWVFKYHYPEYEFDVLGIGYRTHDGETGYTNDWAKLNELLAQHEGIITYNFLYDIGILHMLAKQKHINWNLRSHTFYDVLLLAKLENRNRFSYSLDTIAELFLKKKKTSDALSDYAWESKLYQTEKHKQTGRLVHKRPSDKLLGDWTKGHMNLLPHDLVGNYCIQDVILTWELFEKLFPLVNYIDLGMFSDLQQACIASKTQGVRIDLKEAKKVLCDFIGYREAAKERIYAQVGYQFNIDSTSQLPQALESKGYKLPKTKKGNASSKKDVLATLQGTLIDDIMEYRKANKMSRDFVRKALDYQDIIPLQYRDEDIGVMYPTHRILGATTTGRFSSGGGSGCMELNVQQIPKRDEKFGAPCRKLFIALPEEELGCLDFSSQEPRLQVHYASRLKCPGIEEIVQAYNENPNLDFHQKVADITGLGRTDAKVINLGLGYGMGNKKLCASLKVDEIKGFNIIKRYHEMLPFMKDFHIKCKKALKNNHYIKTLGGRKLGLQPGRWIIDEDTKERKWITFEKDAVSGLVQGSAGDQTMKAIVMAWQQGRTFMIAVHDEIVFSSRQAKDDLTLWQNCMVNAYQLAVPVLVEAGVGTNWGDAKR